jgi:hypothetical protein
MPLCMCSAICLRTSVRPAATATGESMTVGHSRPTVFRGFELWVGILELHCGCLPRPRSGGHRSGHLRFLRRPVSALACCCPRFTPRMRTQHGPRGRSRLVADASGAPVLRDQGPISRPGTARPMQIRRPKDGATNRKPLVLGSKLQPEIENRGAGRKYAKDLNSQNHECLLRSPGHPFNRENRH